MFVHSQLLQWWYFLEQFKVSDPTPHNANQWRKEWKGVGAGETGQEGGRVESGKVREEIGLEAMVHIGSYSHHGQHSRSFSSKLCQQDH